MEYEYCYKVKDLKEYLDYIQSKYKFVERYKEKRVIYRNKNNTIARITHKNNDIYLDFKENKISNEDLIVRKETKAIKIDSIKNCENILSFLNYKKDNMMERYRIIYEGEKIKFEIDEYIKPEKSYVVSFEGDKKICDKVNKEFKGLNDKYKI